MINKHLTTPVLFYKAFLVCRSVPEIGCGSRAKPILMALENSPYIEEACLSKTGTMIAVVYKENTESLIIDEIVMNILKNRGIEASRLFDSDYSKQKKLFEKPKEWFKGNQIDELSKKEARVVAKRMLKIVENKTVLDKKAKAVFLFEAENVFFDFFLNFTNTSQLEDDNVFKRKIIEIISKVSNHIDKEALPSPNDFLGAITNKIAIIESHNSSNVVVNIRSIITCPFCGFEKEETMSTDSCQYFYDCTNCGQVIKSKHGDCCVFCSFGTEKCPPRQIGKNCC